MTLTGMPKAAARQQVARECRDSRIEAPNCLPGFRRRCFLPRLTLFMLALPLPPNIMHKKMMKPRIEKIEPIFPFMQ